MIMGVDTQETSSNISRLVTYSIWYNCDEKVRYFVPNRLVSGTRFGPDDGPKHLFQNTLMSVQVKKCISGTDGKSVLSS